MIIGEPQREVPPHVEEMARHKVRLQPFPDSFAVGDTAAREEVGSIEIPLSIAWRFITLIQKSGLNDEPAFLEATDIAMGVVEVYSTWTAVPISEASVAEWTRIRAQFAQIFIELAKQVRDEELKTFDDLVLSYCYHQLRAKEMTSKEAAEAASFLLRNTFSPKAWRMRLDRWAADERRKLPKIGQTKRSKRQSSS